MRIHHRCRGRDEPFFALNLEVGNVWLNRARNYYRSPGLCRRIHPEQAAVSAGNEIVLAVLRQREDIGAVQALAHL